MALIDNIYSYHNLNESSGNAADSVGSSTGTNLNSTTFTTGKIGNGATLDGINQGFALADANYDWINYNQAFSINMWAKHEYAAAPGGGVEPNFFGKQDVINSPYPGFQWGMTNRTGSELNMDLQFINTFNVNGKNFTVRSIDMLPYQNVWTMVTLTYSGNGATSGVKMYVNAVSQTITAVSGSTTINATIGNNYKAAIGAANGDNGINHFDGMLDEVGVWQRELSAADITELYNGGAGLTYPFTSPNTTNFFF